MRWRVSSPSSRKEGRSTARDERLFRLALRSTASLAELIDSACYCALVTSLRKGSQTSNPAAQQAAYRQVRRVEGSPVASGPLSQAVGLARSIRYCACRQAFAQTGAGPLTLGRALVVYSVPGKACVTVAREVASSHFRAGVRHGVRKPCTRIGHARAGPFRLARVAAVHPAVPCNTVACKVIGPDCLARPVNRLLDA